MFEHYFIQTLTANAPQIVHPVRPISTYSFQHFGRYLTKKCFNVVFQWVNWSGHVCIDMSFKIAPQKLSKDVKLYDLGGQLAGPEREIKCSANSPLNKSVVTRAVWHVPQSCWNSMSCKSSSCILGKKSWISHHGSAHYSQLRYDSQHLWISTVQWCHQALNRTKL